MDKTLRLNELYRKIMTNRRSDMSDEQFNFLLGDLYMMGFNEAADQYKEMSDDIAFEMDLAN
jgi:hypothetical protein